MNEFYLFVGIQKDVQLSRGKMNNILSSIYPNEWMSL